MSSNTTGELDLLKLQAEICKALADPKRLFIIKELSKGEQSVGELAGKLGVRPANVSQHLAILRDKEVVEARREATVVYYRLTDAKIGEACGLVQQILLARIRKNSKLAEQSQEYESRQPGKEAR
jgi:ArsR family transcriptional regulator